MSDVTGDHIYLYSNDYVNDVVIINQTTFYIPEGFGDFFPSLKQLEMISSKLKFIRRSNFAQMKNLLDLRLDDNEIEIIFSDTFWDLKKLQWLSISGNRIKALTEGLTMTMPELMWFTANDNEIQVFDEKCFRHNKKLELVSLQSNLLRKIRFHLRKFKDLAFVDMRGNLCIDEYFRRSEKLFGLSEFQTKLYSDCSLKEELIGGFKRL